MHVNDTRAADWRRAQLTAEWCILIGVAGRKRCRRCSGRWHLSGRCRCKACISASSQRLVARWCHIRTAPSCGAGPVNLAGSENGQLIVPVPYRTSDVLSAGPTRRQPLASGLHWRTRPRRMVGLADCNRMQGGCTLQPELQHPCTVMLCHVGQAQAATTALQAACGRGRGRTSRAYKGASSGSRTTASGLMASRRSMTSRSLYP